MKVAEAQLAAHLRCPVADFGVDLFEATILTSVRYVLLCAYNLRLPELAFIRDQLSMDWSRQKEKVSGADYLAGHRMIPGIALRVVQVLRTHQVMFPDVTSELHLGVGSIETEYAVCQAWRDDRGPLFCLSLQRSKSPAYFRYPDAVTMARWLHLRQREAYRDVQILHLPLLSGAHWKTAGMAPALVRRQLETILSSMSTPKVSRPGPHCEGCVSHRCMELIYDRRPDGHPQEV